MPGLFLVLSIEVPDGLVSEGVVGSTLQRICPGLVGQPDRILEEIQMCNLT
jgi:hypothetical protein